MTRYLLDVNVLIALLDPVHIQHDTAHDWFSRQGNECWATCPITENGVLRIIGHPRYTNTPGPPTAVVALLADFCALPGHAFWPDDISLLRDGLLDRDRLLAPGQVTDSYLLALACHHGGALATFDRRIVTDAVRGGASSVHQISIQ